MKTLKIIIAITILSLFSISCSNDDSASDSESAAAKPVYLLTKLTNSLGYTDFIYDANNKLSGIDRINPGFTNSKTTFSYNSNGKIEESLEVSAGLFSSTTTRITYIYDAQNRLIEKKYFQNSIDFPLKYEYIRSYFFEYNGGSVTQKMVQKGNTLPSNRTILDYDSNGNVIKATGYSQFDVNNPNGLIFYADTYVYDDKLSIETSLPTEYRFPFSSKNNEIKITETRPLTAPIITNIVYEYNAEGYPAKKTVSNQYIYTFEYKKL